MSAVTTDTHAAPPAPAGSVGRNGLFVELASWAVAEPVRPPSDYAAARACLLDAVACALRSLRHPDCVRVLGPIVPGATMIGGARVLGTSYELDPVHAAFNLGAMIRWCADACAGAARECHPADALGAILAVADWRSRRAVALAQPAPTVRDVLTAMLASHDIYAALVAAHGMHAQGRDDVLHVSIASAAVATALLGGTREQAFAAITHAFVDGGPWRASVDADGASVRERWAVGDAASRGVRHALRALAGEPPCAVPPDVQGHDASAAERFDAPPPGRRFAPAPRDAAPANELEVQHRLADAAAAHYSPKQAAAIAAMCADSAKLDDLAVHDFVSALVKN